jgi:hypothetical protein
MLLFGYPRAKNLPQKQQNRELEGFCARNFDVSRQGAEGGNSAWKVDISPFV